MSAISVRMGRPKKSEPTEPMRLPASIVRRIKRLAAHAGMDPGDYVAQQFGPVIDREEKRMLAEIERERREEGGKIT